MTEKNIKIENIIKLLKKNFNEYSICKINDYYLLKNKYKDYYLPISSNYQIRNIFKIYKEYKDLGLHMRLIDIVFKYKKLQKKKAILKNIYNKTDYEIFKIINKTWRSRIIHQKGGYDNKCFSNNMWSEEIIFHLKKNKINPKNYLDIGCGSGQLTTLFGQKLNLDKKNIHGIDVDSFHEKGDWNRKKPEFTFKKVTKNEKLPYKNNYFDLVSSFMVLHHIENLDKELKEINRIIKKKGYFIIREHDCITSIDKMLCDIEHYMFFYLNTENINNKLSSDFQKKYYAKYYDCFEWDYIMDNYGFKFIYGSYISKDIHNQMTPTRSFLRIYQKI